jgi:hypothetical protein
MAVKKEKIRIVVTNSWDGEVDIGECSVCSRPIHAGWGDYLFKIYKGRDKKNAAPLCTSCAKKLEKEKHVKLVPESYLHNQIQLRTAIWRKQGSGKE